MKHEKTQEEKERLLNSLLEAESVTFFPCSFIFVLINLKMLFPDEYDIWYTVGYYVRKIMLMSMSVYL